jgi:hypothetical protein
MKKIFTFLIAALFVGNSFGQTQVFQEYFADSAGVADYNFKAIDRDGDGYNWIIDVYESEIYMISESWDDVALTPNNILYTPMVDLSGYDSVAIEYFVAAAGSDYYEEKYKFVVTTGNDTADVDTGDILLEETLTDTEAGATWAKREFDISSYIDQSVYFAWVHYDCTDMYKLMIDSITVTGFTFSGINGYEQQKISLYPNPAKDHFTINYKGESTATVEVYSIIGQLVKRIDNVTNGQTVMVNELTSGTYMLRVSNGSGIQTRQFIVE